jgi:hypothetical protein
LIAGPARTDFEHSIPPVEAHRYSIASARSLVERASSVPLALARRMLAMKRDDGRIDGLAQEASC